MLGPVAFGPTDGGTPGAAGWLCKLSPKRVLHRHPVLLVEHVIELHVKVIQVFFVTGRNVFKCQLALMGRKDSRFAPIEFTVPSSGVPYDLIASRSGTCIQTFCPEISVGARVPDCAGSHPSLRMQWHQRSCGLGGVIWVGKESFK